MPQSLAKAPIGTFTFPGGGQAEAGITSVVLVSVALITLPFGDGTRFYIRCREQQFQPVPIAVLGREFEVLQCLWICASMLIQKLKIMLPTYVLIGILMADGTRRNKRQVGIGVL